MRLIWERRLKLSVLEDSHIRLYVTHVYPLRVGCVFEWPAKLHSVFYCSCILLVVTVVIIRQSHGLIWKVSLHIALLREWSIVHVCNRSHLVLQIEWLRVSLLIISRMRFHRTLMFNTAECLSNKHLRLVLDGVEASGIHCHHVLQLTIFFLCSTLSKSFLHEAWSYNIVLNSHLFFCRLDGRLAEVRSARY